MLRTGSRIPNKFLIVAELNLEGAGGVWWWNDSGFIVFPRPVPPTVPNGCFFHVTSGSLLRNT